MFSGTENGTIFEDAPEHGRDVRMKEETELESARRWLQEAANKEVSDSLVESEQPEESGGRLDMEDVEKFDLEMVEPPFGEVGIPTCSRCSENMITFLKTDKNTK